MQVRMLRRHTTAAAFIFTVLIAGCSNPVGSGGGGSGEDGGEGSNQAPTARVELLTNAYTGRSVGFDGEASDPEGAELTYRWKFLSVPDDEGPVVTDGDITDPEKLNAAFTPPVAGTYVLELTVSDGEQSTVIEVTVDVTDPPLDPPGKPGVVSPSDGDTGVSTSPTLTWSAASDAENYRVYLGNTSALENANQVGERSGTSLDLSNLENDVEYFWWVEARNSSVDDGDRGNTGGPWSFTTIVAPPGEPTSPDPSDGQTGVPIGLSRLGWRPASGANTYDVYFAEEGSKLEKIGSTSSPPFDLDASLSGGTSYEWQVVARNAGGTRAGQTWVFETSRLRVGLVGEWLFTDWYAGDPELGTSPNKYDGLGRPQPTLAAHALPPQPTTDRHGVERAARVFNGSNQYVQVPREAGRDPSFAMADFSGGLSVSLWFYSVEGLSNSERLVVKTDGETEGFRIRAGVSRDGRPDLLMDTIGNPVVAIASDQLLIGAWNHVVYSWDPDSSAIAGWINGKKAVEDAIKGVSIGDSLLYIGGPNTYFDGLIDDVRVYNRPLDGDDVRELYEEQ
jgi:hypothetical protein